MLKSLRKSILAAAAIAISTSFVGVASAQNFTHHRHTSHHHHDAMGHRIDDAGHHIDLHGHHTGAVGVYDNGAVSYPNYSTYNAYNGYNGYWSNGTFYYSSPSVGVARAPIQTDVAPSVPQTIMQNGLFAAQVTTNRPPQNVLPVKVMPANTSDKIKIVNPADSGGEIRYSLNGLEYSIQQGYSQTLDNDRTWVITFGSGGSKGDVRYTLSPGNFKFKATESGWELLRTAEPTAMAGDSLPPAPAPAPAPVPQPDGPTTSLLRR